MQQYKVTINCPASVGERKGHLVAYTVCASNASEAESIVLANAPLLQYLAKPTKIKVELNDLPVCCLHERV